MKKEFVMIKTWHTEEDEPILISDHASQEAMDQGIRQAMTILKKQGTEMFPYLPCTAAILKKKLWT